MRSSADLLVVGAGIAGTLTALAAVANGINVTWVAPPLSPTDQSAHWHGYLHRGRLYDPTTEIPLIAELERNWSVWGDQRLQKFCLPIATYAVAPDTSWAEHYAARIGSSLANNPPPWLRMPAVPTYEAIADGPALLATAQAFVLNSGTQIVRDQVARISAESGSWSTRTASGEQFQSRRIIVATGTNNNTVLRDTSLNAATSSRLSRMLMLRGNLPDAGLIAPAREHGGLFLVSRRQQEGGVWLISDNLSSHEDLTRPDSTFNAWWACSIVDRLRQVVDDVLIHDDLSVGAYLAPKSGVRTHRFGVAANGFVLDESSTLVSLTPAKWSVTPTCVHRSLNALGYFQNWEATREMICAALSDSIASATAPETWTSTATSLQVRDLLPTAPQPLQAGATLFNG